MRVRQLVFAFVGLAGLPAGAAAGWIEFGLTPSNPRGMDPSTRGDSPVAPVLGPILPPGVHYGFDPAAATPATVAVVDYEPWRLPQPAPRDVHPDGTTHWNMDQYFRVTLHLTDTASGQSADLDFGGRAHVYNEYANGQWSGHTYFWFLDEQTAILGGNKYTVWGTNWYTGGPAAVDVWVGDNPPVHDSPEPGTLLLGLAAVVPAGLRARRRGRKEN